MKKRHLMIWLLLAAAVLLTGCGSETAAETETSGTEITEEIAAPDCCGGDAGTKSDASVPDCCGAVENNDLPEVADCCGG